MVAVLHATQLANAMCDVATNMDVTDTTTGSMGATEALVVVDVMDEANSTDIRRRARDMHQQIGAIRDTLMQLGLLRKKGHLTKCRCSKRLTRIYILQFQRTVTKCLRSV